jgi:hypothetical protein
MLRPPAAFFARTFRLSVPRVRLRITFGGLLDRLLAGVCGQARQ